VPVRDFPDPDKHRLCIRCRQWFEPSQGYLLAPGSNMGHPIDPISAVCTGLRRLLSGPQRPQFICARCRKVRRLTTFCIFAVFAVVVATVFLLEALGVR